MDEVVHLQLSTEEYHIPVPKPDKKQSTNTMRTRFSV